MTLEDLAAQNETDATEPDTLASRVRPGRQPAGARLPINSANLLLIGLVAAGIATVYLLSARMGPKKAAADAAPDIAEAQVNSALTVLGAKGASAADTKDEHILRMLYMDASQRQIAAVNVSRANPFVFVKPSRFAAAEDTVPETRIGAATDAQPATEYEQAVAEVRKLTLQTVLTGAGGSTAMISSNLLTEGQVIRGWTVTAIEPNRVVLTWNDKTWVLDLQ